MNSERPKLQSKMI